MITQRQLHMDTREHLLTVGEELSLRLGFTGMGLSELLATAQVPKGSFYHYFRSKEAFGEAMLQRYFARYLDEVQGLFNTATGTQRQRLLRYYQLSIVHCQESRCYNTCLAVKLSAEVSDLSEPLRHGLVQGTTRIIQCLQQAIENGIRERSLTTPLPAALTAETLYFLWQGAALRAKLTHSMAPLDSALQAIESLLQPPTTE